MKKSISLLLALLLLLGMTACAGSGSGSTGAVPTVLNTSEYVLYQNIFFNDAGSDYLGRQQTKTGTFTSIRDRFNDVTRYYVWGYNDATKCCDWQWEFVPKDGQTLPAVGSLVKMTGTFAESDDALDGYWFTDAALEVQTPYDGSTAEIDMTTMGSTLERVQMLNMQYYPDDFEGKTVEAYGRVETPGSLQDPYYDGSWSQAVSSDSKLPAIGTVVIVSGTWTGGVINGTVEVTNDY